MNNVIQFPVSRSRWSQDDLEAYEAKQIIDKLYSIHTMFVSTGQDEVKLEEPSRGPMKEYEVWNKQKLSEAFMLWKAKWGDDMPEVWEWRKEK